MKRGTPDHPKTEALSIALGIDGAKAVGTLELLWHFTAKFAPQGDIGKWPDDAIAKAVRWSDKDGTPAQLVRGLVNSGWLDYCQQRRLIVHDWDDHADESVKKALKRKELPFLKAVKKVSRQRRKLSGHIETMSENGSLPEPVPEPSQSLALPGPTEPLDEDRKSSILIPFPPNLNTPEFAEAWSAYLRYLVNRSGARSLFQDTLQRQMRKLGEFGVIKAIAILEKTIEKNWGAPVWPDELRGAKPEPEMFRFGENS